MSFREYMRWDGAAAIVAGFALYVFGLVHGDQGPLDAAVSGALTLAGTGAFMAVRHRTPFRRPGAWFTAKPLAGATADRAPVSRRSLVAPLLAGAAVSAALTLALSFLTGFWLTYMDAGAWAIAIGAIRIGPAATAIAQHEARTGATLRVARRPLGGLVELTAS
jgi:hypothetical protein